MASTNVHPSISAETEGESKPEIRKAPVFGGLAVEAIAAVGALILSIVGLGGLLAAQLAAISAIALGVALLFQGIAVGAQFPRTGEHALPRAEPATAEISAQAVAGLAGITLGIIALAGVGTALLAIAAIVLGAGLIAGVQPLAETTNAATYAFVHRVSRTASGAHAFAGVAAIVLGIIELVMPQFVALSLVAFLAMAGTILLGSAAIGGRLASRLTR